MTHLDLSSNDITSIQNLHCLPVLTHLDLSSNRIETFDPERPLKKLESLKLSQNQLKTINLAKFPQLKKLYLDANEMQQVKGLDRHRFLSTLSLRSQKQVPQGQDSSSSRLLVSILTSTPSDLRKLYLSANPLPQHLGGALPCLQYSLLNIQYLDIASCGIASLPVNFGKQVPNLRVLNLNYNALKDITGLRGIVHLNKLLLVGNRLERMRRTISVLERVGGRGGSLAKVDFRGNGVVGGFYSMGEMWRETKKGKTTASWKEIEKGAEVEIVKEVNDPFTLSLQSKEADEKYLSTLDEETMLKRKIWELLLGVKCRGLIEVDGLPFANPIEQEMENLEVAKGGDWIWEKLKDIGVLRDVVEGEGPVNV